MKQGLSFCCKDFTSLIQNEEGEEWEIDNGSIDDDEFNSEWKYYKINENNVDKEILFFIL